MTPGLRGEREDDERLTRCRLMNGSPRSVCGGDLLARKV
jgi:hypothetical protein